MVQAAALLLQLFVPQRFKLCLTQLAAATCSAIALAADFLTHLMAAPAILSAWPACLHRAELVQQQLSAVQLPWLQPAWP